MSSRQPDSVRAVAAHAREVIGGDQNAVNYYDDSRETVVSILECNHTPAPQQMTVTTVSLHLATDALEGEDIRVEFIMHGPSGAAGLANVLSSGALNVTKDGWLAAPGVVYPNLVADYFPMTTVPHVMWAEPQVWPGLSTVDIPNVGQVHWLMAVPLSEPERRLLVAQGFNELEKRLSGVEIWDLMRASAL